MDVNDGNLKRALRSVFDAALATAFPAAYAKHINSDVQRANKMGAGEYQANCAMRVFAAVKGTEGAPKNPREVAAKIVAAASDIAKQTPGFIEAMDVAGPGFINIKVGESNVSKRIESILTSNAAPKPSIPTARRVAVDFSSPNIAKEMHVGHLRSTIIGDTICRVLECLGHDVKRINHVGDWGTQFGMLLTHLKDSHPDFLVNPPSISDLNAFYKASKKRFDDDEDFKQRARDEVTLLQGGDETALTGWKSFCKVSEKMFMQVYGRLGVKFPDGTCGESFYNSRIPAIIEELSAKDIAEESEGALVVWAKDEGIDIPFMVRKSNGSYGYASTDITALKYRVGELKCDWLVYVVDSGQQVHLRQLFSAARKTGWAKQYLGSEDRLRVDHVNFGVVQGKDKKRFKTRSGETVRLVDLLDEAKMRMVTELKARIADGRTPLAAEDVDEVAAKIGYAAVKYADLKNHRTKDYVFDYDTMLSPDGDTAVYLFYAYARVCSMLAKVEATTGKSIDEIIAGSASISRNDKFEWNMASIILQYPEILEKTADDLTPHVLCEYVYRTAGKFSEFWNNCRILVSCTFYFSAFASPSIFHADTLSRRNHASTFFENFFTATAMAERLTDCALVFRGAAGLSFCDIIFLTFNFTFCFFRMMARSILQTVPAGSLLPRRTSSLWTKRSGFLAWNLLRKYRYFVQCNNAHLMPLLISYQASVQYANITILQRNDNKSAKLKQSQLWQRPCVLAARHHVCKIRWNVDDLRHV